MGIPIVLKEEMKTFFRANYEKYNQESLQEVLVNLKKMGYSQTESLFLIYQELGITFVKANKIILNSRAWGV